jgi:hypothetical protein
MTTSEAQESVFTEGSFDETGGTLGRNDFDDAVAWASQ